MVCIELIASAYSGKQVERLSTVGVLTGHSITHSASVITNVTVSEQNLKVSMGNKHRGGPCILHILQLLFYTVLTVRYYTIISLFMGSVHPVGSNRQNLGNKT